MSRIHGPKIVTDGLILYLDSTIEKSYPQISYGPELVTDASVLTAGDGQIKTVSSVGGNYIRFNNIAASTNTKRYKIDWTISARRGTTTSSFSTNVSPFNVTPTMQGRFSLPVGSYSRSFTSNTDGSFAIGPDNINADFDIDYLSIKEILTPNSHMWYDISGNNRHFNIGGGARLSGDKGIYFSGANTYSYESVFNSVPFTGSFTLDIWFKLTSYNSPITPCGTGSTLFSKQAAYGDIYKGFAIWINSSAINWQLSGLNNTNTNINTNFFNPSLNTLYNVIAQCVYGQSSITLLLYVNGALIQISTANGSFDTVNTGGDYPDMRIAGKVNHCGADHSIVGYLYGTKMYNRILSQSEILLNYNTGLTRYL